MPGVRIYCDANVLIVAQESELSASDEIWRLFDASRSGQGLELVSSRISLAEVLVRPMRRRDHELCDAYRQLLAPTRGFLVEEVSTDVIEEAAAIRARHPQAKLPDALHAATARLARCMVVLTDDLRFPREEGFAVWPLQLGIFSKIEGLRV